MTRLSSEHVFSGVAPSPCLDPTVGVSPLTSCHEARTWEGTANVSIAGMQLLRSGWAFPHCRFPCNNNATMDSRPQPQPALSYTPSFSCRSPTLLPTHRIFGMGWRWRGGRAGGGTEGVREAHIALFSPFVLRLSPSLSQPALPSPSYAPPPDCLTVCKTV